MSEPTPGLVEGSCIIATMRGLERVVCVNAGRTDAKPTGFEATKESARLIAARQELLDALHDALGFVALYKHRPEYISPAGVDILAGKLSAAIAKAEGRS